MGRGNRKRIERSKELRQEVEAKVRSGLSLEAAIKTVAIRNNLSHQEVCVLRNRFEMPICVESW